MNTYDDLFPIYYTLFRGEAETPLVNDDEYAIGLPLANEAITRWANYDGTYWKELYTTAQTNNTGGVVTVVAGTQTYAAPTAMKEAGGLITFSDGNGVQRRIQILDPQEAQFQSQNGRFAYFTGNPGSFTLHLNQVPDSTDNGMAIDYVYYKKPTYFSLTRDANDEVTGSTGTTEMAEPYFIVHRMLAQRLRIERNYSAYQTALRDAEDLLKTMQMDNNSGNWANTPQMSDNSGTSWGSGGLTRGPW